MVCGLTVTQCRARVPLHTFAAHARENALKHHNMNAPRIMCFNEHSVFIAHSFQVSLYKTVQHFATLNQSKQITAFAIRSINADIVALQEVM